MKYIILADSSNVENFETPRQLSVVNGEPILKRTIRLLKKNKVKDIIITSHNPTFDNLGATRYEPKNNFYSAKKKIGYWLNAFPVELMNEPITFLFGDVYYSENAIKTIVDKKTKSTLFFCTYNNNDKKYIKRHDEPLAYKVVDTNLFKEHIDKVKKLYDEGKTIRHPIVWEVYRSINNQDINVHKMTKNFVAINDETCDIDRPIDITLLNIMVGDCKMIKVKVIESFYYGDFDKIDKTKLIRNDLSKNEDGHLYMGDIFECTKEMFNYLIDKNPRKRPFVELLEIIPE